MCGLCIKHAIPFFGRSTKAVRNHEQMSSAMLSVAVGAAAGAIGMAIYTGKLKLKKPEMAAIASNVLFDVIAREWRCKV